MDLQIAVFLNHLWSGTFFDTIMGLVSGKPFMLVVFVLLLGVLIIKNIKQRKKTLLSFFVAMILFFLVSEIFFKHILVDVTGIRERPYVAHADVINPIGTQFSDSSFPSSHMTITLSILTILFIFWTGSRPFAVLFALLMAISRIHNGMHYPSDVLVGSFLGIVCGILGFKTSKLIEKGRKIASFKKQILLSILISIVIIGIFLYVKNHNKKLQIYTDESQNVYYYFKKENVVFIKPMSIDVMFLTGGSTIDQMTRNTGYQAIINGSYFGYSDNRINYFPVGTVLSGFDYLVNKPTYDPNLAWFVDFDTEKNQINNIVDKSNSYFYKGNWGFSAGPMIMYGKNNPGSGVTENISHRQGKYRRTVLLWDKENKGFLFGIFMDKVTLRQVYEAMSGLVYQNRIFTGDSLVVLNLDGGPSTAIHSPVVEFNMGEPLPFFIGIK